MKEAVRFAVAGHRRALAFLAATAFLGGMLEAVLLVVLTRAALAAADDAERIGFAGVYVSAEHVLLLALVMILVRVGLAIWAGRQGTRLSQSVVARVQHRLGRAFLNASWDTQQDQQAGSLQQYVIGFSGQVSNITTALTRARSPPAPTSARCSGSPLAWTRSALLSLLGRCSSSAS